MSVTFWALDLLTWNTLAKYLVQFGSKVRVLEVLVSPRLAKMADRARLMTLMIQKSSTTIYVHVNVSNLISKGHNIRIQCDSLKYLSAKHCALKQ